MTAQENEALVRRYIEEAFNKGNMAIVDEVFAANLQNHSAPPGRSPGIEGVREFVRRVRAEWPDIRITIDDQVAEGDKVVTRWTARCTHFRPVTTPYGSMAPTNKPVTLTGIDIHRIDGGQMVEHWGNSDELGLMQQLGAVPTPVLK
ncbi:MAG TPA: ester cyclase [Chloroflexota bacterium]|nr:ester cyclase [Chloroflexota bacterium]